MGGGKVFSSNEEVFATIFEKHYITATAMSPEKNLLKATFLFQELMPGIGRLFFAGNLVLLYQKVICNGKQLAINVQRKFPLVV